MSSLGDVGYQLYALREGLFVVGASHMELLNRKSKADLEDILTNCLRDAEEGDVFVDYKLNRSMIVT